MLETNPSFWLMPRKLMDAQFCDFNHQRAQITYNVLFNGPLVIVDSDFINNLHLRNAVLHGDNFILPMIYQGYLRFAIRNRDGHQISMGESAAIIKNTHGNDPNIPSERFAASPEFGFVEIYAKTIPWSANLAENRYQREVLRVLKSTPFNEGDLPSIYATAILSIVEEYVAQGKSLKWSFFVQNQTSELWEQMEKRFPGQNVETRYGEFVFQLARGPYVTFLPDTLGLNPTYSSEDQLGIDIWRGRYNWDEEKLLETTISRARISLIDFVKGLATIDVDDIRKLRESGERIAYDQACADFAGHKVSDVEPLIALHAYRRLVDHTIFDALRQTLPTETVKEGYLISQVKNEKQRWFKFLCQLGLSGVPYAIPTILEFVHERYQAAKGIDSDSKLRRQVSEEASRLTDHDEVEKEVLIAKMQRQHEPTIESQIVLDHPDSRDVCTSSHK